MAPDANSTHATIIPYKNRKSTAEKFPYCSMLISYSLLTITGKIGILYSVAITADFVGFVSKRTLTRGYFFCLQEQSFRIIDANFYYFTHNVIGGKYMKISSAAHGRGIFHNKNLFT